MGTELKKYSSWKEIPSNLKTKTRLKVYGLYPYGKPVAQVLWNGGVYNLYDETKARKIERKELSIEEFNFATLNSEDLNEYAIVSLTTTGTRTSDEIIQFTILDMSGNFIYNKKFKPIIDIHPLAYQAHKMSSWELKNEANWEDEFFNLSKVLEGKTLIMTDWNFFLRMIKQSCKTHRCENLLDFKLNILDLRSNKLIISDFSQNFPMQKTDFQSGNPIQDAITVLNGLNPHAELFLKKGIAQKYFKELCEKQTAIGKNGFQKGCDWLIKNFGSSDFDNFDLKICRRIASSLEKALK